MSIALRTTFDPDPIAVKRAELEHVLRSVESSKAALLLSMFDTLLPADLPFPQRMMLWLGSKADILATFGTKGANSNRLSKLTSDLCRSLGDPIIVKLRDARLGVFFPDGRTARAAKHSINISTNQPIRNLMISDLLATQPKLAQQFF